MWLQWDISLFFIDLLLDATYESQDLIPRPRLLPRLHNEKSETPVTKDDSTKNEPVTNRSNSNPMEKMKPDQKEGESKAEGTSEGPRRSARQNRRRPLRYQ